MFFFFFSPFYESRLFTISFYESKMKILLLRKKTIFKFFFFINHNYTLLKCNSGNLIVFIFKTVLFNAIQCYFFIFYFGLYYESKSFISFCEYEIKIHYWKKKKKIINHNFLNIYMRTHLKLPCYHYLKCSLCRGFVLVLAH